MPSFNDSILSYVEMCQREGASLQRGMNFELGGKRHSVILMSTRKNAPYSDRVEDGGRTLVYEGHDVPRSTAGLDPKSVDQSSVTPSGRPTQNGRFEAAARDYKKGIRQAERVRVYEKIYPGIWSYNGVFLLIDAWTESSGGRFVFKFRLEVSNDEEGGPEASQQSPAVFAHRRLIPSAVKLEVWQRDQGKCVTCGATTELHFDHDLPYSLGGTSLTAANVQLLCARHNLSKGAKLL